MSTGLRIFAEAARGQFDDAMEEAAGDLKRTAMATAAKAASILQAGARADIAGAGFGRRWQGATKAKVYPESAISLTPTIHVYNAIPFSGIFETGGDILGKPMLWLPLPSAPLTLKGAKLRPKNYFREVGQPLYSMNLPGKPPMLGAKVRMTDAEAGQKVKFGQLRRGRNPGGKGTVRLVPLYFGVDAVTLRDRFHIREIGQKLAGELPAMFAEEFGKG